MTYDVEYDSGEGDYRMVVIRLTRDYSRHRCGYVSVPKDHPFYGKNYRHEIPFDVKNAKVNPSDPIGTLCAAFKATEDDSKMEISYAASVHGGITYADGGEGYPLKNVEGWWFGFDAAHCDDKDAGGKPLAFMIAECEKLRDFLKRYSGHVALAA